LDFISTSAASQSTLMSTAHPRETANDLRVTGDSRAYGYVDVPACFYTA
jgi:hypothetical protein